MSVRRTLPARLPSLGPCSTSSLEVELFSGSSSEYIPRERSS